MAEELPLYMLLLWRTLTATKPEMMPGGATQAGGTLANLMISDPSSSCNPEPTKPGEQTATDLRSGKLTWQKTQGPLLQPRKISKMAPQTEASPARTQTDTTKPYSEASSKGPRAPTRPSARQRTMTQPSASGPTTQHRAQPLPKSTPTTWTKTPPTGNISTDLRRDRLPRKTTAPTTLHLARPQRDTQASTKPSHKQVIG
ncbi:Hypothetical predicted protein [Pelobates cultripes]|uniref:Uncharacterized protein n=1 Tax=Pelobates cultripes TaxID=61616 RepID=A0AAD1RHY7_PELCU|nr:Hypothetical predicted protein [Pelobates cultripes]